VGPTVGERRKPIQQMRKNAFDVLPHICVRVTDRDEPAMFVQCVSRGVTIRVVSIAVDFHDEALLRAEEVDDAIADDVLTPELIAAQL